MSVASIKVELAAMRAQALAVWGMLTMAQKAALRRVQMHTHERGIRLHHAEHKRVADGLEARGLVGSFESVYTRTVVYQLTAEGLLVRRVGLEAEAASSKRSYRKRGAA